VQVSIETHVLDVIREQLSRRQPVDGGSRNVIRTMTTTCGYAEVRSLAAQRLEMWIQNPKVSTIVLCLFENVTYMLWYHCIRVKNFLLNEPCLIVVNFFYNYVCIWCSFGFFYIYLHILIFGVCMFGYCE